VPSAPCPHAERIGDPAADLAMPSGDGCEDCVAMGSHWVHLRRCTACGHLGCCDSSPNRHATGHHHLSGHPVVQSFEPGEDWYWCYDDELMFSLPSTGPSPSHH
jgi:hypothetical protein